jgi:hypothetical protein
MTTTANPATSTRTTWSTRNKVGLAMAILYAITNLPSALVPPDTGTEDGPPMAILVVCSVLSAVALVAAVVAWRQGSRPAARLTAASLIIVTLTSLPAFFVDVPAPVKVVVGLGVVWTIVMIVLMFSPPKRG